MREFPALRLRVLVVWEPVLPTDWTAPSTAVLARVADRRALQFWDKRRLVSEKILASGFPNPLQGPVVWDFVALFPPGARWEGSFPTPQFSGAPVANVMDGLRRNLHSYSSASTKDMRSALSPGAIAARKAAPRITGASSRAMPDGNS